MRIKQEILKNTLSMPDKSIARKDFQMNTNTFKKVKRVSAFAAVLVLVCTLFVGTFALQSSAKSFSEMGRDGYVTDGDRGDRPGIIGDEREADARRQDAARTPAGAYGRTNGNGGDGTGLTGNDIPGSTADTSTVS